MSRIQIIFLVLLGALFSVPAQSYPSFIAFTPCTGTIYVTHANDRLVDWAFTYSSCNGYAVCPKDATHEEFLLWVAKTKPFKCPEATGADATHKAWIEQASSDTGSGNARITSIGGVVSWDIQTTHCGIPNPSPVAFYAFSNSKCHL